MGGLASLLGIQELTCTVADLAEASSFLVSVFGAEVLDDEGELSDRRRSTLRAHANADVRAVIRRSRLLRTPFLNIRLLEATYPGQRTLWPMMLDVGGWHLAGYVDDIDAALEFLQRSDLYVLGPGKKPTTNAPEVGEGSYAIHGMASFGLHFEILTYPNGRAYMADFDGRLWNPAAPDRGATPRVSTGPGLAGFRGFEHVSVGVADIEEASAFFEDALGCERFYDMGPVSDPHGSGFGAYANVDARVKVSKVRLLRSAYLNIELIEPRFPGQNRDWPQLLDVGGWRLGLAVEDVDAAVESVLGFDVHLLGGRREDPDGAVRVSCLTEFGLYFDLVAGSNRGWHPIRPGE
ncbi:VOC family protein [Frankia sp. CNm7]|uniref:VOC family protein n=1 Tax=Frankia nepalensis TaxID=1836974 RepID=A0A937UT15_9ACTN|nr:VOC family protein [Frankia nepalensis]MBL7495943.1 VOC family protein [Frankia nepalensis]MBL7513584.1 VOC family protein [Frankia nepalensis]MBL7524034.1 VOC family protein [Frankia nepalensis]MBL7632668.1 VOC family protein [Frankia nepalensis]